MTISEKIRKNPPTLENRILKMIDGVVSTYHLAEKLNMDHMKILKITCGLKDKGRIRKLKEVCVDRWFYVVYIKI